jgi:hypothetical protein
MLLIKVMYLAPTAMVMPLEKANSQVTRTLRVALLDLFHELPEVIRFWDSIVPISGRKSLVLTSSQRRPTTSHSHFVSRNHARRDQEHDEEVL